MVIKTFYSLAFVACMVIYQPVKKQIVKVTLVLIRTPVSSVVGFDKKEFWGHADLAERIEISGGTLPARMEEQIKQLEPAEADNIDRKAAFICTDIQGKADTLYSDIFFTQWDVHGKIMNDKDGFFKRMLRPLVEEK